MVLDGYMIYLDLIDLYRCIQRFIDVYRFNEEFIKNYNENSDIEYFLEVDVEYPKKLWGSHKDLLFLPERKKSYKIYKNLFVVQKTKKNMSFT